MHNEILHFPCWIETILMDRYIEHVRKPRFNIPSINFNACFCAEFNEWFYSCKIRPSCTNLQRDIHFVQSMMKSGLKPNSHTDGNISSGAQHRTLLFRISKRIFNWCTWKKNLLNSHALQSIEIFLKGPDSQLNQLAWLNWRALQTIENNKNFRHREAPQKSPLP